MKTLIVDDEPLAREGLRILLARDPDVTEILEAKDGREAVDTIRRDAPDLVFLDVQMPEMDGVAVVRAIGAENMPAVVFVTAHDQYAIEAFEIHAVDYLLKPVTDQRFTQALARAKAGRASRSKDESQSRIIDLLQTIASPVRHLTRLAVHSAGKTSFVYVDDVDWMEAAENYVELHTGASSHLIHVAMNTLERSLDPERFLRIHRSIIVNVRRILELAPAQHGEYLVTMKSGVELRSGRTYHEKLKALLANPF